MKIKIIGGGLAGSEAAFQLARRGHQVELIEMRPQKTTPAHKTGKLAELVCSNTFKSKSEDSPSGLLKKEMAALDSLILEAAYHAEIPAGGALGVDREVFASRVDRRIRTLSNIELVCAEQTSLDPEPDTIWIVATGPLTSEELGKTIESFCGDAKPLYFYDAIAPIVALDSLDLSQMFFGDRYGQQSVDATAEGADYLNIPLNKDEYETFIDEILAAEKVPLHAFESPKYFESCLPIEVMAERGRETLRFGPMKPVGLDDPRTGRRPWACIQLRRENDQASMWSLVGFQTKLKWPEQKRIFRALPGMDAAEFYRLGSIHRNTYIESPQFLNADFSFRARSDVFAAGQITGVEGYLESTAIGLLVGLAVDARIKGVPFEAPPPSTVLGTLHQYVTKGGRGEFVPMNVNFGLLPQPEQPFKGKKVKRKLQCQRAVQDFEAYLSGKRQPTPMMV